MWIVRLALRRPYTFVVVALVLFVLTPFVLLRMPTDIFPVVNIPVLSVVWTYSGLSAQEIEQRIIYNHERMIATIVDNIEHIESTAYKGAGVIKLFLQPGASVDAAMAQLSATGPAILRQLPRGMNPPIIIRYNAATVPILQYGFASTKFSESELQDMVFNQVRVGLMNVPGAAMPYPYGGKPRVVAVDLDMAALKKHNLAPKQVVDAIDAQNLILPGGSAKIGATEFDVTLNSSPTVLGALNDMPVKTVNGAVIRVRDVAFVHDGYQPQQNIVRLNGVRGVLLTVLKSGTASTLDVVRGVKAAMPRVLRGLPPELQAQEFADQSIFVRAAIDGVLREGVIAASLTALMVLLFLGAWRGTLIIATSIPLSVLTSIAVLHALGETINLMTLGGLALSVGILVDDATVEIENVHRHMAMGKPTVQAILDGAQEIALPAFVGTLCICIVFVPMFFLTGVARYLFVPLAEAVVFAMLASYVLSRTLVPTLVMWFYRRGGYRVHHAESGATVAQTSSLPSRRLPAGQASEESGASATRGAGGLEIRDTADWKSALLRPFVAVQVGFERGFTRFREGYRRWLGAVLAHRGAFSVVFLAFCLGTALLIPWLGQDFFPTVDAGQFRLHLRARSGTRVEETAKLADQVEQMIRSEIPAAELGGILDNIGLPWGGIPLTYIDSGLVGSGDADILVSLRRGHRPTADYVRRLRTRLNREFPGVTFYFLPADIVSQTINFGLPAPFDIQIVGRDQAQNRALAYRLAERLRAIAGIADVRVQQPADLPQLQLIADRTKASQLGLTQRDVADAMLLGLSGSGQVQPIYWLNPRNGVQYLVNVRVPEPAIDSVPALQAIPVSASRSSEGDAQLFANLTTLRRANIPPIVNHYNVMPVIDVLAGVNGRDLGGVLRDIKPLIAQAEKELPRGSFIVLRGQAQTMNASYLGLAVGMVMALVLVYLLLVVNFQSWLDPFIILTALLGAIAGVIWGLYLTFTTLSVPALMGTIMSLGVGTANAVLLVTFARNNLRRGMDVLTAAWEAGVGRLRPVLMTALAMIIGMLPMALGLGEGGEQNAPLGRAVIGGLIVATFATLFFVPAVFTILHRRVPVRTSEDLDAAIPPDTMKL
jgi:multidrug efflux pump subunit AcrB